MKNILIVGAEKGLGLGLAHEFFGRGYRVTGTCRPGADPAQLVAVGTDDPARLTLAWVDIIDETSVDELVAALRGQSFDILFMNAGIYGPLHQSVVQATPDEVTQLFMTNAVGPVRLATRLVGCLPAHGGMLAFMSSHRGSVAGNTEGAIPLYSASKAALNSLTRSLYATEKTAGRTVLNVHPGWVNTDMGTLGGTVDYEIELAPSVQGVADVVEQHFGSGEQPYVDYQNKPLAW